MDVRPIKTKKDHQALKKIEELFNAKSDTCEGDLLEVPATLVESYEHKYFNISPPDPVEAIKFRMEQMGLKQADLSKAMGDKNRVSEILNRKRELTADMMRNLHKQLNIPAESLLA